MRDGWVETTLGDVAKVTSGFAFSTKSWKEHGIPVIKINNVRNGQVSIENCSYIQEPVPEGASKFLLKQGDLLITLTGEIGAIGFVTQSMPMYLNQRVGRLDLLAREKVSLEFIGLFLSLPEVRAEMWSHGKGNAQLNISPTSIQSLTINLPPLPEQKRIVDLISSVDDYIEALQQQLERSKRSRNAVLHELLTAGGEGWVETTLDGIAEYINGYPFKPSDLGDVGLPVIRIKQLLDPNEPVDRTETGTPDRCLLRDGDIVFSWSGTLAVRIWNRGPAKLNQHLFRVVEKEGVYKGIIPLILDHAIEELEEKSHGTTMKHITKQTLLPHKVLLPPPPEQKRIVEIIKTIDEVISQTELTTSKAQNLRSGLLSDLISGKHEIPASYDKVIGAA